MSATKIISRHALEECLHNAGIDIHRIDAGIAGTRYVLPRRDWIETTFRNYWFTFRKQFKISFTPGSQVCQQFSLGCAFVAGLCYDATKKRPPDTTLCWAELWHKRPVPPNHAINLTILWEDSQLVPIGYEPQLGQIIALGDSERSGAFFVRA